MTKEEAIEAFQKQLSEGDERHFPPMVVKSADDLLNVPASVKEILVVDTYLEEFLRQHPHLEGARNMPSIRKAIETDLRSRGIL